MAAKRFLGKPLKGRKDWAPPRIINMDTAPTDGAALTEQKPLIRPVRAFGLDASGPAKTVQVVGEQLQAEAS